VTRKCLALVVWLTATVAAAASTHGQALPPPRDGDIRVLYWDLSKSTQVWLTLEPRARDGSPLPSGMNLTFSIWFPGKWPERPVKNAEIRANAGFMWAPKVELAFVVDGRENIAVVPPGVIGLTEGAVSNYLPAEVSIEVLARLARAKHIDGTALGLEFELSDFQVKAIRTFYDRVRSDNPAAFQKQEQDNL
jgi:hypothetical protein